MCKLDAYLEVEVNVGEDDGLEGWLQVSTWDVFGELVDLSTLELADLRQS